MSWCNLPMLDCPHCEKEFQYDDYYDVHIDTEIDCPHCEKSFYILEKDTVIQVRIGKTKE